MSKLEQKELDALQTIATYECTAWDSCEDCPMLVQTTNSATTVKACMSSLASKLLVREVKEMMSNG